MAEVTCSRPTPSRDTPIALSRQEETEKSVTQATRCEGASSFIKAIKAARHNIRTSNSLQTSINMHTHSLLYHSYKEDGGSPILKVQFGLLMIAVVDGFSQHQYCLYFKKLVIQAAQIWLRQGAGQSTFSHGYTRSARTTIVYRSHVFPTVSFKRKQGLAA